MTTLELVSADSHVNVDTTAIREHLPSKYHEEYDRVIAGYSRRMSSGAGGVNAAWTTKRNREKTNSGGRRFANHSRPGYLGDGAARLADMDLDGVRSEVIYSELSFFRFAGDLVDAQDATTVAFNDVLHEYASPDPSRLVVTYQIPIQDIDGAIAEVERVAARGAKSLQLPVFPNELGLPDYYHERYDPLFAVVEETGIPICCHIGLNTALSDLVVRDPTPDNAIMTPMTMLCTGEALGMWIFGGVFERYPALKLVFVEPGVGWIPWWLNLVDDMATRQGYDFPDITELPSHYFRRNVFITFIDEAEALAYEPFRYRIGVENIMWSSDYPHPVSSFPNSQKVAAECVVALPEHERDLILAGNAKRVWNL